MARTIGSHSDKTGPRLRAAALRLFARRGYAAVSMREIAAEVGVQVGAIYNYTPDKQSLLFDLMHSHMAELLEAFQDDPALPPQIRLRRFVGFHLGFHRDRPDAVFIAYMELRNLSADNFSAIEAMRKTYEDALETIIQDGAAAGVFQVADTKLATFAVIAMLTGVNTWFRPDGRLAIEDIETQYWQMVRGAVGITP